MLKEIRKATKVDTLKIMGDFICFHVDWIYVNLSNDRKVTLLNTITDCGITIATELPGGEATLYLILNCTQNLGWEKITQ